MAWAVMVSWSAELNPVPVLPFAAVVESLPVVGAGGEPWTALAQLDLFEPTITFY